MVDEGKAEGYWCVIELFSTDASVSLSSLSAGGRASQCDSSLGDSLKT